MAIARFGRQQLRIMLVLWEKGRATARDITQALSREQPVAHSTVQTLLRGLERRGVITHDVEGRTFVFRPLKNREKIRGNAIRELIDRFFDDCPGELVSHLLASEQLTPREREVVRAVLNALAGPTGKKPGANNKKE